MRVCSNENLSHEKRTRKKFAHAQKEIGNNLKDNIHLLPVTEQIHFLGYWSLNFSDTHTLQVNN